MCPLRLSRSQIYGKLYRCYHIFAVWIHADRLGPGVSHHLLFLSIQCISRKSDCAHVITQRLLHRIGVPGTGKHGGNASVTKSRNTRTVGVDFKIRISRQIYKIICHFHGFLSPEIHALCLVRSISEQGTTVTDIKCRKIPGVCHRERDNAFFQHRIQIFHVLFVKYALVIVHKPGVCRKRYTVKLPVLCQG